MKTKIKVSYDWERDGILVWENAQTIELYKSLKNELSATLKGFEDKFLFAFSDKQFENDASNLPDNAQNLKVYSFGAGCFATERAIKALFARTNNTYKRIKNECDPQEVYYYEYNNHECCIRWDGDSEAIYKVMCYFGDDVARTIKRDRAFYTIDEIEKMAESQLRNNV